MKKVYIVENLKTKEKGLILTLKQRRQETSSDRSHIYEEFKYKTSKVLLSRQVMDTKKNERLGLDQKKNINIMPLRLVSTRWRILSIAPPQHLVFEKSSRPTLQSILNSENILDSVQDIEVESDHL